MDANRYFDAMHNAMSAQNPGAQLLLTVKLQDTCGNDACLELKQLPELPAVPQGLAAVPQRRWPAGGPLPFQRRRPDRRDRFPRLLP